MLISRQTQDFSQYFLIILSRCCRTIKCAVVKFNKQYTTRFFMNLYCIVGLCVDIFHKARWPTSTTGKNSYAPVNKLTDTTSEDTQEAR